MYEFYIVVVLSFFSPDYSENPFLFFFKKIKDCNGKREIASNYLNKSLSKTIRNASACRRLSRVELPAAGAA
jgi:hypothetical protein